MLEKLITQSVQVTHAWLLSLGERLGLVRVKGSLVFSRALWAKEWALGGPSWAYVPPSILIIIYSHHFNSIL